jgi:hypothetical protein
VIVAFVAYLAVTRKDVQPDDAGPGRAAQPGRARHRR